MAHSRLAALPSPRPSGVEVPDPLVRLHLAASAPTPSHVDGAWWPRSTNLVAELPALLDAVHDRTGDVALVGFHQNGWDRTADQDVASQRWRGDLVARPVSMERQTNQRRTQTIERWVREAAVQFLDAPVQADVPILVEHIVRQQITASTLLHPRKSEAESG